MASEAEKSVGGRNRWRMAGWGGAILLLMTPFFAMQVTDEVNWGPGDFLFAAMMFGLVGLLLELAVRESNAWDYRAGVMLAVAAGFLLIWSNLAVGFLGDEDNPANALFFMIPAIAILGGFLSRFQAPGMAVTMMLSAIAQILIPAAVAFFAIGHPGTVRMPEFPLITAIFAAMWVTSALLFRRACRHG